MSGRSFEWIGGETVFEGRIISVEKAVFRFADGEEAEREVVHHPGAVAAVVIDDEHVWLVRQPREPVGDPDSLELPAGKLDEAGESPLETMRRELAEEIGKAADEWEHLVTFHTSVGVMDEVLHLYLARGLRDGTADADENERIEVVPWPLADLGAAIAETKDAKTLVGLLMLKERLQQ